MTGLRSFGVAMATLSTAFLIAGFVWPYLASRLLQVLLATLAVAYAAARVYRSDLPSNVATDSYSPFDGGATNTVSVSGPAPVRDLARLLKATEDREAARRVPIPSAAHRIIVAEATRRLAEHHGLGLSEPDDHPRVKGLVSDATWALIQPSGTARGLVYRDPVPLEHLENILDDVERL